MAAGQSPDIVYFEYEFSRRHAAFDQAEVNTGTRWSEIDLVDLGHMLTRELPR